MKNLLYVFSLMLVMAFPVTSTSASDPGTGSVITGFWLSPADVNTLIGQGALTLKVYAALDEAGNSAYVMVGCDGTYHILGGETMMQTNRGICPPSCEFDAASLDGLRNTATDVNTARSAVYRYMTTYPGISNCAKFTISSITSLVTGAAYIKVSLGTTAKATGYKADGTTMKATVTGAMEASEL